MNRRFELIIFDWDGTLANSIDWIVACIRQAAEHHSCPIPEPQAVKNIIGLSIENAMQSLFPNEETELRQRMAAHYAQAFFSKPINLFPGVEAMLERFNRQGYKLAIATGKKASGLNRALADSGIADLFSTTRCADQTASKPNPLMLEEIIAELGVSKQRALMVGDSIHDLQMAINADVVAIGVTCGAHSQAVLQPYHPLMCLSYPTDLLDIM